MGMFPENRHAINDVLSRELFAHEKICKDTKECGGDKEHRPYLEYCLREIGLYLGYEVTLKRWT